MESRLRR